jgi:hypothetical protein
MRECNFTAAAAAKRLCLESRVASEADMAAALQI